MKCPNCGYENTNGTIFCFNCGKNLADNNNHDNSLNYSNQNTDYNTQALNTSVNEINNEAQETIIEKNKPKKKLTIILIGLVLIFTIGVIYYIFIQKNKLNDIEKSNEPIYSDKQNINIAVIGHLNHGKTLLTSAITKVYGNYISESELNKTKRINKNGAAYNMTKVSYETANRHYTHYDFPENTDFVKAILSESILLDGAILVVAADEGIMPQTRDQLYTLHDMKVDNVVVYISKCNLVSSPTDIDLVEVSIKELLKEYGYSYDTPIIRGDSQKAINGDQTEVKKIKDLFTKIDEWIIPTDKNKIIESKNIDALIYVLDYKESGKTTMMENNQQTKLYFDNKDFLGTISTPNDINNIFNGQLVKVTIKLNEVNSMKKGSYFQIKDNNTTIAIGFVIDENKENDVTNSKSSQIDKVSDNIDSSFFMTVDTVYTINGNKVAVTGKVKRGEIHVKDNIKIVNFNNERKNAQIDSIIIFEKDFDMALAGNPVTLILNNININDVNQGYAIIK